MLECVVVGFLGAQEAGECGRREGRRLGVVCGERAEQEVRVHDGGSVAGKMHPGGLGRCRALGWGAALLRRWVAA